MAEPAKPALPPFAMGAVNRASARLGARSVSTADEFFAPVDRMLADSDAFWDPNLDWAIVRLGHAGLLKRLVVDTAFFKGNFPDTCELPGANLPDHGDRFTDAEIAASEHWTPILSRQKLQMDHAHEYAGDDIADTGPITHVRFAVHPDGDVMRLRLFGTKA